MILPSTELLQEVLGNYDFDDITIINNTLRYHRGHYEINIYELIHKCKEWIDIKGYVFIEDTRGFSKISKFGTAERKFWEDDGYRFTRVFKACEWVLNKEKENDK